MYLHDILVYSESAREHVAHLHAVFERLCQYKLYAKQKKCTFASCSIKYLGHIVENGQVCVDDDKVTTVRTWPTPTCVKHVLYFLGLANYYSEYIEKFAEHAAPLSNLLRKS